MSWHYLQEQGEESWAGPSLDGAPDALLNLIPTRAACCSPASETECCPASRSGMTSPASTASPGEDTSMLSAVDSPARIFPALARGQASQASGLGFGGRWHELSVKFDRDTSSWRTHLCLFDEDLPWSSVTLPRWGMMLDGVCWELTTQGLPTVARESGYWPTPPKFDAVVDRLKFATDGNTSRGDSLARVVKRQRYATPPATANQLCPSMQKHPGCAPWWPTPAATDHKGSSRPGQRRGQLTDPNMGAIKAGGQLNPTWVEWLMGWPLGWTDLKPLATDRYRSWQRSHGQY